MIANGHNIDDIKDKYTVDQVYRFYELCRKSEVEDNRRLAIAFYNSLVCTAQTDKKGQGEQKRFWRKYLDSLDWNKIMKNASKKPEPFKVFQALGNIVKKRGKK